MTRRPIFIGAATVLALVLTAGLAYGAGRMMAMRSPNQGARQPRIVGVVPGHFIGSNAQTGVHPGRSVRLHQGWRMGQSTSGGWMMGRHSRSWVRQSNVGDNGRATRPGHQSGAAGHQGSGYWSHSWGSHHHNHMGSGSWGTGSGYDHHHCWGWR